MSHVINPEDYDPEWPGDINYEDWVMLVRDVDKYTPKIIDHIIIIQLRAQRAEEAGDKPKRGQKPKLGLEDLKTSMRKAGLLKPTPKLRIRRMS